MASATSETRHSICTRCLGPITITIKVGQQKWHDVKWQHVERLRVAHPPQAELRIAVDATCPRCDFPEVGFAPARQEFVCSRCEWTCTERPVA